MRSEARRQCGFTLGELLATVAVAGIAASLALPGLNQAIDNQKRTAAIGDFVTALHLARSTAITRSTAVTVCPSTDGHRCDGTDWAAGWIVFEDPDGQLAPAADHTTLASGEAPAGLSIRSRQFPRFLAYRPNGQAMAETIDRNTGEFVICDRESDSTARALAINAGGKPRLHDRHMDGSPLDCPA